MEAGGSPCGTDRMILPARLDSARVDGACQPYPGRWTHHIMIGSIEEIDDQLLDWLRQAASFAAVR